MIKKQLRGFKKFILRGNVVDLAVGVAIGGAFTGVVTALVSDLITPLINAFVGNAEAFNNSAVIVHGHKLFFYGHFLNVVVAFILTAAVVFFLVVEPVNKVTELANRRKKTDDPSTKKCTECLSEIPRDARRCKYCTSRQSDVKASATNDK